MRLGTKGLRSVSMRAWRASLSPMATALVACSLTFVILGSAAYVAAIPPVFWQEVASGEGLPQGDGLSRRSAMLPGEDGLLTGSDLDAAMQPVGSSLGGSISLPSLRLPDAGPSGSATEPEAPGVPEQPGGDGPSGSTPEPPAPSGPSAEQEARYHAALVAKYAELTPMVNEITAAYESFYSSVLVVSADERAARVNGAVSLMSRFLVAAREMREVDVPQDSVWHGKYTAICGLYSNLSSASALLQQAWFKSWQCTDPANDPEDQAYFMEPLLSNSTDGKLNAFIEFEQNYPGARP